MSINLQIAFRLDLQVEMSVPCNLRQHVIEKRNTRGDPVIAGTVEIKADVDVRFVRLPRLDCCSRIHYSFSKTRSSAARNLLFSSGVPIEIRRHRSSSGYALTSRTSTPCAYSRSNISRAGFAVRIKMKFAFEGNARTALRF